MCKDLAGKVALVTGGSRGIGAAVARRLAEHGADVALSYAASADKAQAMVKELERLGIRAAAFAADQADRAGAAGLVAAVVERFGRLDILVVNAGVGTLSRLDDEAPDLAALDREYAVNMTGVAALARAAARVITEGGRIVLVGSSAAVRLGFPGFADYAATKGAVAAFARGAAHDLAKRNITVNVVQPGPIETDMNPDSGDFAAIVKAMTAFKRYGRPEEVAAGIVFLAGPAASYITGATLNIDGGLCA
uniref:Ketoreductase domain-containing protein n=1 Tax=Desulfovibrio sp. U5L TaxID=596152 RepID=I2Q5X7_9BACT